MKKKILCWYIGLFIFCGWADLVWGQQTFTQEQALEMIKLRDAQWEGKIEKADSLIASQKVVIRDCENLVAKLEGSAEVDSLLLNAPKTPFGSIDRIWDQKDIYSYIDKNVVTDTSLLTSVSHKRIIKDFIEGKKVFP